MIKLGEVLASCSNPWVASAALASIGGGVAGAVRAVAEREGAPDGVLVAQLVREFRDHACPSVVTSAEEAMRGSDLPVLTGLQHILAHALIRRELQDQVQPATTSETPIRKVV